MICHLTTPHPARHHQNQRAAYASHPPPNTTRSALAGRRKPGPDREACREPWKRLGGQLRAPAAVEMVVTRYSHL